MEAVGSIIEKKLKKLFVRKRQAAAALKSLQELSSPMNNLLLTQKLPQLTPSCYNPLKMEAHHEIGLADPFKAGSLHGGVSTMHCRADSQELSISGTDSSSDNSNISPLSTPSTSALHNERQSMPSVLQSGLYTLFPSQRGVSRSWTPPSSAMLDSRNLRLSKSTSGNSLRNAAQCQMLEEKPSTARSSDAEIDRGTAHSQDSNIFTQRRLRRTKPDRLTTPLRVHRDMTSLGSLPEEAVVKNPEETFDAGNNKPFVTNNVSPPAEPLLANQEFQRGVMPSTAQPKERSQWRGLTFASFLALEDDDIAEFIEDLPLPPSTRPPPPTQPLPRIPSQSNRRASMAADLHRDLVRTDSVANRSMGPSPHAISFNTVHSQDQKPLMTTPTTLHPIHHELATAAALEAARIATTYGFDLVYVISLSPNTHNSRRFSPPNLSSATRTSPTDNMTSELQGMKGCLLAAYGLDIIKPPFKISTAVHQKILRSRGWIEYRNPAAMPNQFMYGYACSFHNSTDPRGDGSGQQSQNTESGLIFAAYKRPSPVNGSASDEPCESSELGFLYIDVKNLVDMLVEGQHPPSCSKSRLAVAARYPTSFPTRDGDTSLVPTSKTLDYSSRPRHLPSKLPPHVLFSSLNASPPRQSKAAAVSLCVPPRPLLRTALFRPPNLASVV